MNKRLDVAPGGGGKQFMVLGNLIKRFFPFFDFKCLKIYNALTFTNPACKRCASPAFTLAEVLITLAIIGIVAAMTIPSVITNVNERQYKSALKKNFSVFQNTFNLIYGYSYDEFRDWDYTHSLSFTTEVAEKLFEYLSIQQVCGHKKGCMADTMYAKNKKTCWGCSAIIAASDPEGYGFILNDGTSVFLNLYNYTNITTYFGVTENLIASGSNLTIIIDVNGLKKPNTLGVDIFAFVLTDVGLVPAGIDNDGKNCDNLNVNYNWDCTYKVLGEK